MKNNIPLKLDPLAASKKSIHNVAPYIPGKSIQEIKEGFHLDSIIKLASNECPIQFPDGIRNAIINGLEAIRRYPDSDARRLRHALSEDLNIPFESIMIGNGGEECLTMIGQAFLNPCDESIIPDPSFDAYRLITECMGAKPVYVPLNGGNIDLDKVLASVTDKTKIVWVCSPNNPTGTIILRNDFDHFLERLPEGVVVVLDQAYWEFIVSDNPANSCNYIETDARVIGLRTFSKVYGLAGLRVGYLMAHPAVVEVISKVKVPFNVNVLAQAAAEAALKEKQFKANHIEMIRTEREKLIKAFKERGLTVQPTETNFIMVPLDFDGDELFKRLLPEGIIIRPGSVFGIPNAFRLSIGNKEENEIFLNKFDKVMASLTE